MPSRAHHTSVKRLLDMKKYQEMFFTKMIPFCEEAFLNTNGKLVNISMDILSACFQFIPTYSNNGLCLTRNGASLETRFRENRRLSSFKDTFLPIKYNQSVKNIKEDQSGHHFTFLIDGNKFKDLKRGVDWMKPSFSKFHLAIHQPNETGDIRGWSNKIINVPSGQITTIRINLSQQKSKESIRTLPIEKRGCKFADETGGLSSFKLYSNVNCLFDCKMKIAERFCGCRPWDYPVSVKVNQATEDEHTPLCNFKGSSCFNWILRKEVESECKRKCIPSCNMIDFQLDISVAPLDPDKRICDSYLEPFTILEYRIRNYLQSLFSDQGGLGLIPELKISNVLKDSIRNKDTKDKFLLDEDLMFRRLVERVFENETYYSNDDSSFKQDCMQKLKYDIAAVVVSIDSPTFSRTTKRLRVTFQGKLASIGKIIS